VESFKWGFAIDKRVEEIKEGMKRGVEWNCDDGMIKERPNNWRDPRVVE
jgi:hypothetical protein